MDLNKLFEDLDNLQLSDIETHRKKLEASVKLISSPFHQAPLLLLDNYVKVTEVIEKHKAANPKADLSIYDNLLQSIRAVLIYIENLGQVYKENEYLQSMVQTQSTMLYNLQDELAQYTGIEAALINGTLKEKITTVLNKVKK